MQRTIGPVVLAAVVCLCAAGAQASTCNPRMSRSTPDSRFVPAGDGQVRDLLTGLTWMRCPLGFSLDDAGTGALLFDDRCRPTGQAGFLWKEALQAVADLDAAGGWGGAADWRLPNQKELESLLETACYGPAINARLFPDTPAGWFYSSTPNVQGSLTSTSVRGCTFAGSGTCGLIGKVGTPRLVRLVRG
jgi:hypothetical protein